MMPASTTSQAVATALPAPIADHSRPLLVAIPEARRLLGNVGKTAFYSAVKHYDIKLVHLGGRAMVPTVELDRVFAALMAAGPSEPQAKVAAATAASLAARQARPRRKRGSAPP